MKYTLMVATWLSILVAFAACAKSEASKTQGQRFFKKSEKIQLGPRPFYLVSEMKDSRLKRRLERCENGPFYKTDFSIGHRGAPLLFPEHTKESYEAAAKQGAGIMECDVTFTKDGELVCRHAQCDLHTTTNILDTPLASSCKQGFQPAQFDENTGVLTQRASAKCCTSDITLAQFKTLCGKMDAANSSARTVAEYLDGTANFRTDLYTTCGTLLSHKESIRLFKKLNVKFTPELKSPDAETTMPFDTDGDGVGDFSQQDYAQKMIDEYRQARVSPRKVWAQSFNLDDVKYWIDNNPRFGQQAVYLDSRVYADPNFTPSIEDFRELAARGVKIVAPPMFALLTTDSNNQIVPSNYAILAKEAGLDIITWTIERSGRLVEDMKEGSGGKFYYQTTLSAIENDGDMMTTLDVLARQVGILGIFSDWPATVTYYANCMRMR